MEKKDEEEEMAKDRIEWSFRIARFLLMDSLRRYPLLSSPSSIIHQADQFIWISFVQIYHFQKYYSILHFDRKYCDIRFNCQQPEFFSWNVKQLEIDLEWFTWIFREFSGIYGYCNYYCSTCNISYLIIEFSPN